MRSASAEYRRASHAVAASRRTASVVDLDGRRAALGVAQHALRLQLALFGARELLHQADPRHRHEIASERPGVRPFRRNVFDADLELRVRQFARGSRHLARGFDHCALRSQLRRPRHREPDRLGQRQRVARRSGRRRRDDGEDGGRQHDGDPAPARRAQRCRQRGPKRGPGRVRVLRHATSTKTLSGPARARRRAGVGQAVEIRSGDGRSAGRSADPRNAAPGARHRATPAAASAASGSAGTGSGASAHRRKIGCRHGRGAVAAMHFTKIRRGRNGAGNVICRNGP